MKLHVLVALIIQSFARDFGYGPIGAEPMAALLGGRISVDHTDSVVDAMRDHFPGLLLPNTAMIARSRARGM